MTEAPRLKHNRDLAAAYIVSAGSPPRWPKVSEQVECLSLDMRALPPFAYNPSVYRQGKQTWISYRYHFAGDTRTKLGMAEMVNGVAVKPQDVPLEGCSLEDARLFSFHGEMWMSWGETNFTGQSHPTGVVRYAQVTFPFVADNVKPPLTIGRVYQVEQGANDGKFLQKNWCFFESDENLFCIYSTFPEYIVMQIHGDKVTNEYKPGGVRWPWNVMRGGNVVKYDGKLLRFFHSRTNTFAPKFESRYYVAAMLLEPRPPFTILSVSKKPILYGSELPRYDCFHFKPNVVFPCGIITDGDGWIVALGINDAACVFARIRPSDLQL